MSVRTQTGTLAELADRIVATHHQYLRGAMPRVTAQISELRRDLPIGAIAPIFASMRAELELHMQKEELVLFPFIARLEQAVAVGLPPPRPPFGSVENPIRMMEQEHDSALVALAELRRLTDGYSVPAHAGQAQQMLFGELAELERDLMEHIRLENDILFPRAVELEKGA
jgi:regulator of cell morphogenesis and NO signaling